jgi:hypothetical protein
VKSRGQDRATAVGLACSVLSVLPGVAFLWLGFPFVVAGAGIALGLVGLNGRRRGFAIAAIAAGAILIGFGSALYIVGAASKLS